MWKIIFLIWQWILPTEMIMISTEIGGRRPMNVPLHIVVFQSLGDTFMPLQHFRVRFWGEGITWNILGKGFALGVDNIPHAHRVIEESPVLIRVHEQLDGLPAYEAIWAERGNRGWFVGTFWGLQTVETPEGLVYEGESLRFGLEKEWIVVPADLAIERGEAVWSEIGGRVGVERGLFLAVSICTFWSFRNWRTGPFVDLGCRSHH
jgi:hypothetical protein